MNELETKSTIPLVTRMHSSMHDLYVLSIIKYLLSNYVITGEQDYFP